MNRRIVAALLVTAGLSGCFLFGDEETEEPAPPQSWGGSGGGGGSGGFGGFGGSTPPDGAPGFLQTDGVVGVALPIDSAFALSQGTVDSGFTLEVWVRPLRVSEGGTPCDRTPPDPLPEPWPPDCQATDLDYDVCGPIVRIEDDQQRPLAGLDLDGRCVGGFVGPATSYTNPSRWNVPAGAWTHLALRGFSSVQGDWRIDRGVNGSSGGDTDWVDGPLYFGDRGLRLGGAGVDGPALAARFDELRLRRDKLSDNDLKADARGAPRDGPLVAWWTFDDLVDGVATELRDRVAFRSKRDATGLVIGAGGVRTGAVASPEPGCRDGGEGVRLDAAGDLVACRRVVTTVEEGLESATLRPLCGDGFHLCRMDDAPLLAFAAGPDGPEGVAGCYAIGAVRGATLEPGGEVKFDEIRHEPQERSCHAGCSVVGDDALCGAACSLSPDGPDADGHFEPERLAIGLACDVDRPFGVHPSCPAAALPAIRAPENEGTNDCTQQPFVVDGVVCCRN